MPPDTSRVTHSLVEARSIDRLAFVATLAGRASVPPRRLVSPGPDASDLSSMIAAAAAAPSHGGLRNFRFVLIAEEAREALADLFVKAEVETNLTASADDLARAREKAMHAPTLILIVARAFADHPDIPVLEQHVSAGAALGAFLSAAHGLGFGAMAVSGEKMRSSILRTAFCLADFEQALCFVAIGIPNGPARAKTRPDPAELVSTWPQG